MNENLPDGDGKKGIFRMKRTPVKTFKPNSWGLYDMHGNVGQWCFDAVDADDRLHQHSTL